MGACAGQTGRLRPARPAEELFSLLQEELARSAARPGFAFRASLAYRDRRQDFHFLLDAWHDKARRFTRVVITGSLDAILWAELVAFGDSVELHIPHENRRVTGGRESLGMESAGGIHVSIGEILSLVEMEPAVNTNRRVRGADVSRTGRGDILFLEEDPFHWSAVEFSPDGAMRSIRDYSDGQERVHILYENRVDGIARKQTIFSRAFDTRLTLWLSSFDPGWRHTSGSGNYSRAAP
jgi:hypothetical protein